MTAVQQVFSDLLALHPQLFNIYSVEGREFVNHFHKYLDVEKEQMIKNITDYNINVTEMSNESWEGCNGCTEQDEIMYKNGYVKGYNYAMSNLKNN